MTVQFQIDADGDFAVTRGNLVLVDDTAQRVTTRLRMLLGEWFLDTTDGTPYFQSILIKSPNMDHVRSAFMDRVLGTEGVRSVQSMELDFDHVRRSLSVSIIAIGPEGAFEVVI